MESMVEIERKALDLPEGERAVLATRLIESLAPVLHDEDEGLAEAMRRDADMDAKLSSALSLEELDQLIRSRGNECGLSFTAAGVRFVP